MSEPKDGGPAFPFDWKDFQPTTGEQVVREQFSGMALREWFAGQVEFGQNDYPTVCASMKKLMGEDCPKQNEDFIGYLRYHARFEAIVRYIKADALLAARKEDR